MHQLLTASLLLAGYALQPAWAQNTTPAPTIPPTASPTAAAPVAGWVGAEFSEAYGRYFADLPPLYRYTVSQSLRGTPLLAPGANSATVLGQNEQLRERVYQSLYQYCQTLKYGLGRQESVEALVYLTLYRDFHLSDLAATQLTYSIRRYTQPAPPPPYTALPTDAALADKRLTDQATASFGGQPTSRLVIGTPTTTTRSPPVGWQLLTMPEVARLDDTSGHISFRVKVTARGEVESVAKLSGSVSPEQERAYRAVLLQAHFTNADPYAPAAAGTYNFRYLVR